MGSLTEINSLVRLPGDFDISTLQHGQKIKVVLERERILPLRIALLYFHTDWNFLGYCRVLSLAQEEGKTRMEIEVLTIFSTQEQALYKAKFIEAGRFTGETK